MSEKLILASTSPFRRELLERLGVAFDALSPDFDEGSAKADNPKALAELCALGKAESLAARYPGQIVIGSDQVAELDGKPLGKPGSVERAVEQLSMMSGRTVHFHTGLALVQGEKRRSMCELFTVHMRKLTEGEIRDYIAREKPLGCAGSFKIEGLGIALMEGMEGRDFTSLIGLPLIALRELLEHFGVRVLKG
jgi:septum formation protein